MTVGNLLSDDRLLKVATNYREVPGSVSYTLGMKTAVSIPDKVFEEAEQLARRMETSRSALYARALAEYIARHGTDQVTALMNETLDDLGVADDGFAAAAAQCTLQETEW